MLQTGCQANVIATSDQTAFADLIDSRRAVRQRKWPLLTAIFFLSQRIIFMAGGGIFSFALKTTALKFSTHILTGSDACEHEEPGHWCVEIKDPSIG